MEDAVMILITQKAMAFDLLQLVEADARTTFTKEELKQLINQYIEAEQ